VFKGLILISNQMQGTTTQNIIEDVQSGCLLHQYTAAYVSYNHVVYLM